jgi:hypothetical protein
VHVTGFRVGSEQEDITSIGLADYASSTLGSGTAEIEGTIQSLVKQKKISPDTITNLEKGLEGTGNQ